MIYLIGGAPRLGKSTFAKALQADRSLLSISTDAIRAMVFQMTDPGLRAELLPCCVPRSKIGEQFKDTTQDWVKRQTKEAQTLHAAVFALIDYHIRTDGDLVLEGVHILPTLVQSLMESNPMKVKAIFITDCDEGNVLLNLSCHTSSFNWLAGLDKQILKAVAKCVVEYSNVLERQAQILQLTTFRRTQDFVKDTERVLNLLTHP
jgi:hypothetical protein